MRASLLLLLAGCPWVGAERHREAQAAFGSDADADADADADTDTDADTDADADTDTDTDTDADTDTDPTGDCVDDALEDNDVPDDATFIAQGTVTAVLCPDDEPWLGESGDLYEAVVGTGAVVDVEVTAAGLACDAMALRLEVLDSSGNVVGWVRGGCPRLVAGGVGEAESLIRVVSEAAFEQPYTLTVSSTPCEDADLDGYLASSCGGPDCDDTSDAVSPAAAEVTDDRMDQDCDGGDRLGACSVLLGPSDTADTASPAAVDPPTTVADTLPCGQLVTGAVWDRWVVPAGPAACVEVIVDNLGMSDADPLVRVRDSNGDGLDLDNETPCVTEPWSRNTVFPFNQQCPAGGAPRRRDAEVSVWVAQLPDPGGRLCPTDAPYGLHVWVDGVLTTPVLAADDVVFTP